MQISILPEMNKRLKSTLLKAGPREVGGILAGVKTGPSSITISDFSIDDTAFAHSHYTRCEIKRYKDLKALRNKQEVSDDDLQYIGEWHTHPIYDVKPSQTDILTMQNLVESNTGLQSAVLLITKLRWFTKLECSASFFANSSLPQPMKLNVA